MKNITLSDLIQIAKAGFPERCREFIDFDYLDYTKTGDVYRLHDLYEPTVFTLPHTYHMSLEITNGWVHFGTGNKAFNQLAAINKMIDLGILPERKFVRNVVKFLFAFLGFCIGVIFGILLCV